MREIQYRRKLQSQTEFRVEVPIPIYSPTCLVKTRYFEFIVPSCQEYSGHHKLEVIGRGMPVSDDGFFARKRLMITSIMPLKLNPFSLKDWSLLVGHWVLTFRKVVFELLLETIPPYQGGLVLALVFGNTEWLVESLEPQFKVTGTLHILAASGQNIALVLLLAQSVIPNFLNTKLTVVLLFCTLAAYILLIGAQPSILRAGIMASQAIYASKVAYVQYKAIYGLCVAFVILVAFRPEWLYSMGFLLSVTATLGIILFYSFISALISRMAAALTAGTDKNSTFITSTMGSYIIEAFSAGLAAQLSTFPLLFTQFGAVALGSPVPSMLVGWLVPLIINTTVMLLILKPLAVPVITDLVATLLWLQTDMFIRILKVLSLYDWLLIENAWLN